jgi:RNA polymerase-binding transcription factor DksA
MAAKKPKKAAPAKSASKSKPAAKKPAVNKPIVKKPAAKPAAKPAPKPVSKPVPAKEVKPAAKPADKKAVVAKPIEVVKPVVKPVPPPVAAPVKKGGTRKIPLPSRIIKKDPIVVTHSPESQELIKKTIEPRMAKKAAEAGKKPESKKNQVEEKPVLQPMKRSMEKKPMIMKSTKADSGEAEKKFYSKEELEEFRVIINEKMAEAKEEYKRLAESLHETNEMSADGYNMTEFGSDTIDKEQTEMFLARQKKFMHNLDRALVRIENGSYGRCKVTGKLIPKERLRLVPHTESSIEAKQQQYDKPSINIDEF